MLSHSKKTNYEMKMKEKTTENVNQEKKGKVVLDDYFLHKLVIIQLICKYPFSINEGQAKDR